MKNKLITIGKTLNAIGTALIWLWILWSVVRLLTAGTNFLIKQASDQPHDKWDVMLECQKISATATNKGWEMHNCIDALEQAVPQKAKLLQII